MSTPAELDQDIEAYEAMRDALKTHHLHKFVVFHNAEFIESFDTFHNAGRDAVRRFGQGPYLIRQDGPPRRIAMSASVAFLMRTSLTTRRRRTGR